MRSCATTLVKFQQRGNYFCRCTDVAAVGRFQVKYEFNWLDSEDVKTRPLRLSLFKFNHTVTHYKVFMNTKHGNSTRTLPQ